MVSHVNNFLLLLVMLMLMFMLMLVKTDDYGYVKNFPSCAVCCSCLF